MSWILIGIVVWLVLVVLIGGLFAAGRGYGEASDLDGFPGKDDD